MSEFVISLLDLCMMLFSCTDNLIVFVPAVSLFFCFCFGIFSYLMRGGYK